MPFNSVLIYLSTILLRNYNNINNNFPKFGRGNHNVSSEYLFSFCSCEEKGDVAITYSCGEHLYILRIILHIETFLETTVEMLIVLLCQT